jgi:hypothetical protein
MELLNVGTKFMQIIPFLFIPERDLSMLFPFSQAWEKGLGDEGFNYLSLFLKNGIIL